MRAYQVEERVHLIAVSINDITGESTIFTISIVSETPRTTLLTCFAVNSLFAGLEEGVAQDADDVPPVLDISDVLQVRCRTTCPHS
jgi:hypothetical protein